MKLKRYCVTVMDNWTPTREFWTLEGATKFYRLHRAVILRHAGAKKVEITL